MKSITIVTGQAMPFIGPEVFDRYQELLVSGLRKAGIEIGPGAVQDIGQLDEGGCVCMITLFDESRYFIIVSGNEVGISKIDPSVEILPEPVVN